MSYGKDDFLDWDDEGLDLGALLGEYTCSEIEITDDEVQSKRSKKTVQKEKIYHCDNCDNSYSSVSGLRGHLLKKHGVSNVKGLRTLLFNHFLFRYFQRFFSHVGDVMW